MGKSSGRLMELDELFGDDLADTPYAIGFLNACVKENHPGVVFKGLQRVFHKNSEYADILLPAFAPHLTCAEIEQLGEQFPFLSAYVERYKETLFALSTFYNPV